MSSEAATLGVTLNRDRLNQATAPSSFAVDDDFLVVLENEGEPVHVHLRFDGPLADATRIATSNHYVDGGATRTVEVAVASVEAPVEGTLEVITGHGAEGTEVAVTLDPPSDPVEVDESLSAPAGSPSPAAGDDGDGGTGGNADGTADRAAPDPAAAVDRLREGAPDGGTLAVVAVALVALVVAVAVGATLNSLAVSLGVLAVVVAVAAALFLLLG
ncbi:DUF7524 family protein [Halobaculum sp. EA56]|uniref:DUF7524 family protein n=1 Tax=Halobaculum sp. EA56 TaxID=3421648 RepID=UPI003EBC3FDD